MKKWQLILLVGIFVASFFLMFFSARSDSATTDENVHLFAGFTYLKEHDFRLDPEHPPLIKEFAALPLLIIKPHYDLGEDWQKAGNFYYDSWKEARSMGTAFMYSWGNDPKALLLWSRLMMIFLTLGLGVAVFIYARKLYGINAGLMAAFLTLFNPIILAHGRLVNTDLGVTLFSLLTIYFWSSYVWTKSWKNFFLSGIFLGLALASKYTAVIFVAIITIILLWRIFFDKKDWLKIIGGYFGVLIIAGLIIWATYGFSLHQPPIPTGGLAVQINSWSNVHFTNRFDHLYDLLRPFFIPADFFKGLQLITRHVVGGNGSFLLGHTSTIGWWYYFPVAIFFKTSIALFIFIIIKVINFKKIPPQNLFQEGVLLISILGFLLFAIVSRANLGVRHVLPIYPFLIIFTSSTIDSINLIKFKNFNLSALLFFVLIIWYLLVGVFSYPNYLAYFNEFALGSRNGYKILTDSNLDWGQDIYRIRDYLVQNNIHKPYLVYPWDGDAGLENAGVEFIPLTPEMQNIKGPAIVSATYYNTEAYAWLGKYPKKLITPGVFLVQIY